ncbi:TetR/AcrR family transcriptional regulator [Nocardioides sp. B-3]|uniref:TetR/AcrR family transcriptional regulator n=1 Tax=Nocardioides sp. B-3 TaxID=2895565 RepID=UPI002152B331|nr:TetR/AcrR family transcriptional regulator [Nocardioides sp. B-3]UUZ60270.1 TetR/AcrR family transcriptional regulator [Nocardioides sp. B-3]
MTPTAGTVPRTRESKADARRDQLAESALITLGERGYAKTSLREIAQNSPFSHGVLHYYFDNKIELITYCVRYYKAQCVTRYDEVVATSTTADELRARFADKLVETLTEEPQMHRLWYDLRTRAMFEADLRQAVLEIDKSLEVMIWRVISRFAELSEATPTPDAATTYALLDGVFEKALLEHLTGTGTALPTLHARVGPAALADHSLISASRRATYR